MALDEKMLVTVSICTRNRAAFLEKAIRSVLPQLTPDTELIVVDNASTDETRAVCDKLAKEHSSFAYHYESRLGLSAARNTSIGLARGKYVLFLDDDAIVEAGWLETYRAFIKQPLSEKIGAIGGAVIPSYDAPLPRWVSRPKLSDFNRSDKPLLLTTGALSGCNSAYHGEAVKAVGMFDEHLGYKGDDLIPREESELQDRLIRSGWECWWLPGAGVQHHVAADRLTIKGMTKSAYNSGRGAAFHRLKVAGTWHQRFLTRVGRLVASLFQIAVSIIQAFFLLVLGKPEPAIGALCRVARAAGWAVQMVKK